MNRRIRIGVDTGGTFTDVVAIDESTGELATTKTPSTPADPAQGFLTGIEKVLSVLGLGGHAISAVSHGTTVATNKLLEGKVENLGFITTEGYEHVLEIARQSVPAGYGNSYFWVKPPRIVPADRVARSGPDRGRRVARSVRSTTMTPTAAARWFRDRHIASIGVCFIHAYANPAHEERMLESSERASGRYRLDLLRGASRVPGVRAQRHDTRRRRRQAEHPPIRRAHHGAARRLRATETAQGCRSMS